MNESSLGTLLTLSKLIGIGPYLVQNIIKYKMLFRREELLLLIATFFLNIRINISQYEILK